MFRCPSCGQAQEIELDGEMSFINVNETKDGHGLHSSYLAMQMTGPETWTAVTEENVDAVYTEIQNTIFPTGEAECPKCHETAQLSKWRETWLDPLRSDKLETDNLCHCGGELWLDQIPGSSNFAYVCDKCQWVKPNVKVSGS